jgi:transketolase
MTWWDHPNHPGTMTKRDSRYGQGRSSSFKGIRSRIVSMPSWDIFEHQTDGYRDTVMLPQLVEKLSSIASVQTLHFSLRPCMRRVGTNTN